MPARETQRGWGDGGEGGGVTDPKPTKNPTQHGTAAMALLVVDEERPGTLPMALCILCHPITLPVQSQFLRG
jgi:hypothetical protein